MTNRVENIRFQIGASFKGSETVELCMENGESIFMPLTKELSELLTLANSMLFDVFEVEG